MTRPSNNRVHCPNCKCEMTAETSLGRWLRGRSDLRSEDGINIYDEDHFCDRRVVHKFKDGGDRSVQCYMVIEVKEYGAMPSQAQQSTLSILSHYVKNSGANMHTSRGAAASLVGKRTKVFDHVYGREVIVRHYGYHLLQFEKTSPDDSEWIRWDGKDIDAETMVALLRFDVHPYTFRPLEARDKHKQKRLTLLDQPK